MEKLNHKNNYLITAQIQKAVVQSLKNFIDSKHEISRCN